MKKKTNKMKQRINHKLNGKNENSEGTIKLPDLDPESDEYWLELRKKLGIN